MPGARQALVGSDSFQAAIARLPGELARRITDAVVDAFSSGVARSMVATAVLSLLAPVVVAVLWPRRRREPRPAPTNA